MFSHPELSSDPPNGSGRESGRDKNNTFRQMEGENLAEA